MSLHSAAGTGNEPFVCGVAAALLSLGEGISPGLGPDVLRDPQDALPHHNIPPAVILDELVGVAHLGLGIGGGRVLC